MEGGISRETCNVKDLKARIPRIRDLEVSGFEAESTGFTSIITFLLTAVLSLGILAPKRIFIPYIPFKFDVGI